MRSLIKVQRCTGYHWKTRIFLFIFHAMQSYITRNISRKKQQLNRLKKVNNLHVILQFLSARISTSATLRTLKFPRMITNSLLVKSVQKPCTYLLEDPLYLISKLSHRVQIGLLFYTPISNPQHDMHMQLIVHVLTRLPL